MNYKIVAKYIKDLKFEIPNPKVFFSLEKDITNYKINIDIKSNQFKNQIVEVETTLALNPINDNFERINTKIIFSTIIEIDGELTDKKFFGRNNFNKSPKRSLPRNKGFVCSSL